MENMQQNTTHHYDPNRLLDTLCNWLGLNNDKALSRKIQVSSQVIQGMREGRQPVRMVLLQQMADCTKRSIDELRRILGDRRQKARLSAVIRRPRSDG